MLVIRLARVGKKKHPTFRLVVSEKTKDTKGDFLELLGSYDPHTSPATVVLNAERITYWISKGAQPSGSVHNILIDQKVITGEKIRVANIRKKPVSEEKAEAKVEAKVEAAPAETPPAEAPTPTPEAPKEEPKKEPEAKKEPAAPEEKPAA